MVTIEVDGQLEERLKHAARTAGADPQAVAKHVLDENLPKPNEATLALLADWESRYATVDPVELQCRQVEGNQFMSDLAHNRMESEGSQARKLWP